MALLDNLKSFFDGKGVHPNSIAGLLGWSDVNSSLEVSPSSFDGLKISDDFIDHIHSLQKDAAAEQMAYQTQSAERAMQFSAEEAQKNRDWQEHMSSTAYQRAMSDMKAAGLNPILAAGSSMAASTPSGASASGIAQTGSQAAVAETNYGLEALKVYIDALSSAGRLVAKFL